MSKAFLESEELRKEFDIKDDDFFVAKGEKLFEEKKYEDSIKYFDKAIRLNPEDDYSLYSKGICLGFLKRYEEAIDYFNKAIELNPKNESYFACKGFTFATLQRFEEALDSYERAIEINHKEGGFWSAKGEALCFMERYEEAIDSFDKAVELDINDGFTWYWKAECLLELKRCEEAIGCYDRVIKLDDNHQDAWSNKGFALTEIKRYEEAAFAYEKSMSINPGNILPKLQLTFLYRDKLNKMDKAIEIFNLITKEDVSADENKDYVSRFYQNKALFELYKQNEGLAKEHLLKAFEVLEREDKLSSMANMYSWITSGSVIVNLGYSSWLLAILKEKGYDIVLSPYYTAIQALEIETQDGKNGKENAEIYLKNIAIEVSAPARIIIDKMKKYIG